MPVIKLTPDMLGEITPEGAMGKRPTQDTAGTEITAMHATVRRVSLGGKKYFVTIPLGRDHPDNTYELAASPQADPAPSPKSKA